MSNDNISEITIIYIIQEDAFNIFGYEFVKNNKNNCKIEIDNIEMEITDSYSANDNIDKTELKIKLKGINKLTDLSYMFNWMYIINIFA